MHIDPKKGGGFPPTLVLWPQFRFLPQLPAIAVFRFSLWNTVLRCMPISLNASKCPTKTCIPLHSETRLAKHYRFHTFNLDVVISGLSFFSRVESVVAFPPDPPTAWGFSENVVPFFLLLWSLLPGTPLSCHPSKTSVTKMKSPIPETISTHASIAILVANCLVPPQKEEAVAMPAANMGQGRRKVQVMTVASMVHATMTFMEQQQVFDAKVLFKDYCCSATTPDPIETCRFERNVPASLCCFLEKGFPFKKLSGFQYLPGGSVGATNLEDKAQGGTPSALLWVGYHVLCQGGSFQPLPPRWHITNLSLPPKMGFHHQEKFKNQVLTSRQTHKASQSLDLAFFILQVLVP